MKLDSTKPEVDLNSYTYWNSRRYLKEKKKCYWMICFLAMCNLKIRCFYLKAIIIFLSKKKMSTCRIFLHFLFGYLKRQILTIINHPSSLRSGGPHIKVNQPQECGCKYARVGVVITSYWLCCPCLQVHQIFVFYE